MAEVVRELWRSQSPTPCGQGQLEPAAQRCVQLGVSICKESPQPLWAPVPVFGCPHSRKGGISNIQMELMVFNLLTFKIMALARE